MKRILLLLLLVVFAATNAVAQANNSDPGQKKADDKPAKQDPGIRILMFSASGEDSDVLAAVEVGARGYLVKSARTAELLEAVRRTAAGDATFHAVWTLHSAPPNPTGVLRSVMTVIYFADGLRVIEPQNPGQQFDLYQWLPGLKPGDLAASPINPLLYPGSDD